MSIPVPIHDSKGWGLDNGWGSNYSSQTGSPDQPSSSLSNGVDYFSLQSKSADPSSAPPKRPPDVDRKPARRAHGSSYIGPKISDSDETSDEEADFEKFKMQTRIEKIFEFHREAAHADMDLALALHNDRKAKKSSKASDALRVQEHGQQMLRLQAKKEEERKALVEAERGKRRNEIRKRSALREPARAANTNTHQSWDTFFDSQSIRLDIDGNGKLLLRPEGSPEGDSENQMWDLNPLDMLRGRKPSISRETVPAPSVKQSGWKTTSTSAQPQWPTTSTATPIPERKVEQPSWFSDPVHPLAQSMSFDDDDFQFPGGFPDQAKAALAPAPVHVVSGWAKKAVPGKVSPSAIPSSSTSMSLETKTAPITASPPTTASSKKPTKKQRPGAKKPGVDSKVEVETLSTESELEMSSTPRPGIPHMMKSFKADDVSSTPRPSGLRRLQDPSAAGNSAREEAEEPSWTHMTKPKSQIVEPRLDNSWARTSNQKSAFQEPHVSAFSASVGVEDESLWERMKRQKLQGADPTPPAQPKPYNTVDEGSLRGQTMNRGLQGANAPSSFASQSKVSKVVPEEEGILRERMLRKQQQGPNHAYTSFPPTVVSSAETEETPWQRMERLKAQGQDNVGSGPLNTRIDQTTSTSAMKPGQRAVDPKMWTPSDNAPTAFPASKLVPPQPRPNEEKYWTPGGGTTSANHRQGWGQPAPQSDNSYGVSQHQHASDAQRSRVAFAAQPSEAEKRQAFVPTSIMKGSKAKKTSKGKTVMLEEISDEEGPDGRKPASAKLPSNSRSILDIVEPKPSVPSTMFTNIFQYGEGEEEEGYDTGSSSMAPTPSTAPTSPPGEVPAMDEEWLSSMAEDIKNGDWNRLLDTSTSESTAKAMYSPWSQGFHENESAVPHSLDSAKLFSALESVDDKPLSRTIPASKPAPSPPRPAVVEKKVPEKKEPEKKEPEKKEPEKKEPVKQPPPKETKAKGKAKGKGRK